MGKEENKESEFDALVAEAIAERDGSEENENNEDKGNSAEHEADENSQKEENSEKKNEDETNGNNSEEQHPDNKEEFKSVEVNFNGQTISLDTKEELDLYLAKQAQNDSPSYKDDSITEAIIKQSGVTDADLQLLADVKAGKPGALSRLAKESKIDLADAEEFEGDYTPEFTPKVTTSIEKAIADVRKDDALSSKFSSVVEKITGEDGDEFLNLISSDVNNFNAFVDQVKSGVAEEILPIALKKSMLTGAPIADTYVAEYNNNLSSKKDTKPAEQKEKKKEERQISEKEQRLRDRVSKDTGDSKSKQTAELTADDMWDEDIFAKVKSGEINLRDLG